MAATTAIQGIPFAPGRAHGRVLRDPVRATGNDVLLISQAQLADARVRPAAFVVAGGRHFLTP